MLELMRKHARNWLVKILLGMVIVVFIFYFGSYSWRQQAESIAVVDGKVIPYVEFQRKYQNLIDAYRQRLGSALTDDVLKSLNIKQQAYDSIINQAIILQKAKELNIEVTEEEVKASILSHPAFQRAGVFDEKTYQQVLRYIKMTPSDFEEAQKNLLATIKLEDIVQSSVKVSDKEVFDLYRFQNEKINVYYLSLAVSNCKEKIIPHRVELETYLKEYENDFRIPEQIQIKYLSFFGQHYVSSVNITDTDALEYYNRNKDKFVKKGSKGGSFAEVRDKIIAELKQPRSMYMAADEAKKAHDIIYQKENFDEYARQHGLKISSSNFFSAQNLPQEFRHIKDFPRIVFSLQMDEISSVFFDDKTYYVMKLIAKKPPYTPSLNEIEKEVRSKFVETESSRVCKKDAEGILERLKKGEALHTVAQGKGLKIEETGFFQPGSSIPKLGSSKELGEALFQISEKTPYPENVHYVNGKFIIVKFKERDKADADDFETKKGALKNSLLRLKKSELTQSWIESNKEAMKNDGRLKYTKDLKDI
jgi:peptidyl-prolyl cis-trans isomerase D